MQEVYIIAGARTPVGVLQGSLSDVSAIDLGVIAAKGAIERSGGTGKRTIVHPNCTTNPFVCI